MTNKFIAIIQTGQAIPSALEKYGDFNDWFIRGMGVDPSQTKTYRVFEQLNFPNIKNVAGIIITGSGSMVTEKLDWSEATINWLKQLLDKDIPILGVCYGHQLLANSLGGTVDWNPNGREIGQVDMHHTSDLRNDSLFANISDPNSSCLKFIATHSQSVTQLPNNVTLLGSTNLDPNHVFRYKKHIWGLQFHPEFTADIIQNYIHARATDLVQEGLNPNKLIASIGNTSKGVLLLERFKRICLF
ncbi:MAG: glutamine amidotransferase [Proteobacteria bacterium]|nr:glutamine amidotransferase [Pseudomonadota bacterium]